MTYYEYHHSDETFVDVFFLVDYGLDDEKKKGLEERV